MKTTRIKIRNLYGIKEAEIDGRSIELTGPNGVGKTSVIDAIRYALTNDSKRDFIIHKGKTEGEILVETDTGLTIDRKKRTAQADYKLVKDGKNTVSSPESFLKQLFTPLQLNPVEFTQMSKKDQNRAILDLIDFKWDLNFIKDKFGEIPQGINYEQNILQVLNDIQAENSPYFIARQDLNREARNKRAFIEDIAKDIPQGYNPQKWESYDLSQAYKKINSIKEQNSNIQKAKFYKESYDNKLRAIEAEKEIAISAEKDAISAEREGLLKDTERMQAQIRSNEEKLSTLDSKLTDKTLIAQAEANEKIAKLNSIMQKADELSCLDIQDTSDLENKANLAEQMKKHINEYNRMVQMQNELQNVIAKSETLTSKIELARDLPGQILKTAKIPVAGLEVKDGIPLINGLPVSNLSEGEQLCLCVDVAISKPNGLQIILIDGAEKLSAENRQKLYSKCKEKGLQFVATRTTDTNELEVNYL